MRDSFVFYSSFYDAIQTLDAADAGECVKALANYALNGVLPEGEKPLVKMFFTLVKPQIDANNQKYENGLKGGRPKNQTETKPKPKENQTETKPKPKENQTETKAEPNVNDNVNVNVLKEKEYKEKEKRFVKPSIEEITDYCLDRKNNVNAEKFYDFYECKGWKVGKNPMKDWRAAVRNWERMEECRQVIPAANDIITRSAEDEERSRRMMSIVEATKARLEAQVKAKYGV